MRLRTKTIDFPSWLDTKLGERGWEVSDLAQHAGVSASIIHRWRKTHRPDVVRCRSIAQAFGLPALEVLIAAGIITPEEAKAEVPEVPPPPSVTTMPTVELTRELRRRAEQVEGRAEGRG